LINLLFGKGRLLREFWKKKVLKEGVKKKSLLKKISQFKFNFDFFENEDFKFHRKSILIERLKFPINQTNYYKASKASIIGKTQYFI